MGEYSTGLKKARYAARPIIVIGNKTAIVYAGLNVKKPNMPFPCVTTGSTATGSGLLRSSFNSAH